MPDQRRLAILLLTLTTALWGLSFPTGKALLAALSHALPRRDSWFLSALIIAARFGFSALLLVLARPSLLRRISRREWHQGLLLGGCSGAGMWLQADALSYTAASTVAFLTQLTCVLVPLVVVLRNRIAPSRSTLLCLTLVIPGIAVLAQLDWHTLRLGRGELETLLATTFFTVQILVLETPHFRANDSQRMSLVMFASIALLFAPLLWRQNFGAADATALVASWPLAGTLLVLVVLCSLAPYLLMNRWQPAVDATTAGIVYCTEPLFTTLSAMVLPALLAPLLGVDYCNETMTPHLIIGGILITAANLLLALRPPPKPVAISSAG